MADGDQGLDWMGRTLAHYGALNGDVAGLRAALAHGADPGLADKAGMTPLHFAAQSQAAPGGGFVVTDLDAGPLLLGEGGLVGGRQRRA